MDEWMNGCMWLDAYSAGEGMESIDRLDRADGAGVLGHDEKNDDDDEGNGCVMLYNSWRGVGETKCDDSEVYARNGS
jgi:hypothetical protein